MNLATAKTSVDNHTASSGSVITQSGLSGVKISEHSFLIAMLVLGLFGIAMIGSASLDYAARHYGSPFYFVNRQLIFISIGLAGAVLVMHIPLSLWERYGPHLMVVSLFLLLLVLIPGIGREVNGARRWIDLRVFTVQVSEIVKLFVIVYLAGYLVRRGYLVQNTFGGFFRPLLLITMAAALLVLEPDFGAAVVILATSVIMIWVAGVRIYQFFGIVAVLAVVGALLIRVSSYRLERVMSFRDPFSDAIGDGFQLVQSLIAIGSGGLTGVGFGNSVQKMFYLPEAHTDFLFAILCEELGLLGAILLVSLYGFIVWRCFNLAKIADEQGNRFAGFMAVGIGSWLGLQSFINMGVSLGVLPTKGITLPLMSYGGSSVVVFAVAFAVLLRVEYELRQYAKQSLLPRDFPAFGVDQ